MALRGDTFNRNQTPAYDITDGATSFDDVKIRHEDTWAGVEIYTDSLNADVTFWIEGYIKNGWVKYDATEITHTVADGDVAQILVMDIPVELLRIGFDPGVATTGTIEEINWDIR